MNKEKKIEMEDDSVKCQWFIYESEAHRRSVCPPSP